MDNIEKIIEALLESSVNSDIQWTLSNSSFNSQTSEKYTTSSLDGLTKFNITIDIDKSLKFSDCGLWIENANIVDGKIYLSSIKYKSLNKLGNFIYKLHMLPNIKPTDQETVFNDILNGINLSVIRDKKIEDILTKDSYGDKKYEDTIIELPSGKSEDIKKGILDRWIDGLKNK